MNMGALVLLRAGCDIPRLGFRPLVLSVIALAMLVSLFAVAMVQPSYAQARGGQGAVIREIVVEGNERIEDATVRSYMETRPGDVYDPAQVDRSLKTLFSTGLFADVSIRRDGERLIVRVVENPIINRIAFEGNDMMNQDRLREEVRLRPRTVYTRAKVEADIQRIVELYRRSGRLAAQVQPKIVRLPQNRIDLIFEINEGRFTGIRRIAFVGNEAFSDRTLRGVVATKQSRWWRFFSSHDNYDPDRIAYDREQLRQYYLANGYADFQVMSAVAELAPDGREFFLTFTVNEGPLYRFGDIAVDSQLKDVTSEALRARIPIREGQTYNATRIEDAIDNLTFVAGSLGYAFVDIRPRVRRNREDQTIDVTFVVEEGPRVYIERINVVGNVRTRDEVIRRELRMVEGDAFNRILMERSRTRVRGLGFFREVRISEQPGSAEDRTVIDVEVEEQATGELSLSFGYSSTESFVTEVSLAERNLLGRGQFLRLALALSGRRQQADIRFTEPYFMGRNLAAGVDLFRVRTDFSREADFVSNTTGLQFRVGFPLSEYRRLGLRYGFRLDQLAFGQPVPGVTSGQSGDFFQSILGYTYIEDRRDDPIRPRSGWFFSINQDYAGLGGDVNFLRSEISSAVYHEIHRNWILMYQVETGFIETIDASGVRINDRFFKGGGSFRGFELAGIGPRRNVTNDALGAKFYAVGTVELEFPNGLPDEYGIRTSAFTDFGTVGGLRRRDLDEFTLATGFQDSLSMRMSVGISINWDSPMGPLQLDFSHVILKEPFDRTERFRFSAGTRF
jgi:outer membrane protein insertion porin family